MKNWKPEALAYTAGWLEKVSVGSLVVGLFQPEHIMGGLLGGIIFFIAGLVLKIRGVK